MSYANLNTVFNIAELFHQIHGYKPAFVPGFPQVQPDGSLAQVPSITRKTENLYGTPLYGQSDMIGREVFCPVTIEVDGKDYYFPFSVIGADRDKVILETGMSELGGSAKVITGCNDWVFTLKGMLIGDYGEFPDQGLKDLNDVFEFNQAVRLKSAYSDIFLHDNDSVVIYKMSIPEKPKVIGVRDFAMQLKGDNIFTLYQE